MAYDPDLLQYRIAWEGEHTRTAAMLLFAFNWCDSQPLCRGNLGIPRRKMPQIRPHAMSAFLDWVGKHGVTVHTVRKRVQELRATQLEIDPAMIDRILADGVDALLSKKPMLASKDGYILDGHHRWAALLTIDPDAQVSLLEFSVTVRQLLDLAWAFPGVEFSDRVGDILS